MKTRKLVFSIALAFAVASLSVVPISAQPQDPDIVRQQAEQVQDEQ